MPLIHVLWYLNKYLLGSGYADAVVVVDDTPAMSEKIAMSDVRTKVAFLAVSAIKQKDLGNAVRGALQHAIIMRCMLEADQTAQRATAATWDTQEEWLQRGIPLWVLDSNRGYEGHQQVHAAEAVQEDVVTEAPADETEPAAPTPTLPMQAKVKKTAKVIATQGTAAGQGTSSSSKKQAKGKEKELDKPSESDDDDADEEEKEEDPEQVLETQQKRKRAPASHFDAGPESGKEQPKKKGKTAASASAEFKPPSLSAAKPSRGTVASPSGLTFDANAVICPHGLVHFFRAFISVFVRCALPVLCLLPSVHICFHDLECARPRALRYTKKQFISQDKQRCNWRPAECHF